MVAATARYIGLRTWRYAPPTTSRSVGATGAGVPIPSMTKRAKAWSRNATPVAISTAPATWTRGAAEPWCQCVMDHGINPATTPGATRRNRRLPRAALALRVRGRGFTGERRDQLGQSLGLVLRDEGVGVLDPLEPRTVDRLGQPLRERDLEEPVLDRPGEHGGPVEGAQLLRRLERVLRIDPLQDLDHIAADPLVGQVRIDPLTGGRTGEVALDQPPVGVRQPAHRREPHAGHHRRQATGGGPGLAAEGSGPGSLTSFISSSTRSSSEVARPGSRTTSVS